MTSFFAVGAVCMMWGAWRRNADLLLVPAMLFGATLAGRAVNLAVLGGYPGLGYPDWRWRRSMSCWRWQRGACCAHKLAEIAG